MLPWFWLWAPQVHWPFSGDVAQDIAPDTRWFFNAIPPEAGIGALEQKIFETHSYGRQLSALTRVLLDLAERSPTPADPQAQQRLAELKAICADIQAIKSRHEETLVDTARAALLRLQQQDPAALRQVLAAFAGA